MSEKALDGRGCFRSKSANQEILEAMLDSELAHTVPTPIFQATKSDRQAVRKHERRRMRRRVGNYLQLRVREENSELAA